MSKRRILLNGIALMALVLNLVSVPAMATPQPTKVQSPPSSAAKAPLTQGAEHTWTDTFSNTTGIASSTHITQVTDATGGVFGADFTPYSGNPLSTLESSDPWDAGTDIWKQIPGAVHPDVHYFPEGMDGYKFWMIFTPLAYVSNPPGGHSNDYWWERPTLVRSNDGIHWVKTSDYTNPLVSPGAPGEWDDGWHADPDFVYAPGKGPNGESWFLYYTGCGSGGCAIALAMSQDGKHYTKYGTGPVAPAYRCPAVIYDSAAGIFRMWYNWGSFDIGYATSMDGINWTPYGSWGTLVYQAHPGTYDQGGVTHEDVVWFGGQYHMYYLALPTGSYSGLNIGHATSLDGITWVQYPTPAMTPGHETWGFWKGPTTTVQSFYRPSVVPVGDTLYMYYGGTDTYSAYPAPHYDIGLAFPSTPEGHVELAKASQPAEYPARADTAAWYHMNEGNPTPPTFPGEYTPIDTTLAWYHLNEGSGSTTEDVGGPINDIGSLQGTTWTAGLYGNGLSFDGNDQVTASDSLDLNPQNGVTIEAWVNPSVTKSNNYVAIKMTPGTSDYIYGLKIESGAIGGFIRNGGTLYFSYGGQVPLNTWTHIAMTYQAAPTLTYVRLYLNGAEVSSYTTQNLIPANTLIATNTGPLNIGRIPVSSPSYYQGVMDELRIVGRALTAQEIAVDGAQVAVTPEVQDSSGNNNNGTSNSGVNWTTGRFSYGLQFNGSTGTVVVPYSSTLNPQDAVTLEAWVNPSVAKENAYVVNKASPGIADYAYGLKLESGYTGYSEIGGIIGDPSGHLYFAYGGSVPNGAWTHIAMTYQVGDSHIRLYKNGVEVTYRYGSPGLATDTIPANTQIRTNTAPLNIGFLSASTVHYFSGIMDEVRILNRALTPGEIATDYGSSYSSSGNLTSVLVTPSSGQQWDRFYASDDRPAGTNIQYSILGDAGQALITSVMSGTSISSLGSVPIRLYAELATSDPASTPVLYDWSVTSSSGTTPPPPPLPSSFYGEIHVLDHPPQAGDTVAAHIAGVTRTMATTITMVLGDILTYKLDVPGDVEGTSEKEGGVEGDTITFTLNSRTVATAPWHSGTNTRLDLHSYGITLQPGWNLVSFNLQPVSTAITDVMSSLAGAYDLVYAWDAPSQNWLKYDDIPMSSDTLNTLDETMGFWIHITTTAQMLSVAGRLPTTTSILLSAAGSGWNLISYPSVASRDLPEALSAHGVGTDFSLVYAYRAIDTSDPWKLYDRSAPVWSNSLSALAPDGGYWVQVSAPHTLTVDYDATQDSIISLSQISHIVILGAMSHIIALSINLF